MDLPLQLLMVVLTCLILPQLDNQAIINKNMDSLSGQGSLSVGITWGQGIANLELHVNIIILETGVHLNLIMCSALLVFHFVRWVTWTELTCAVGTSATCSIIIFPWEWGRTSIFSGDLKQRNPSQFEPTKSAKPCFLTTIEAKTSCTYTIFCQNKSSR